MAILRRKVSRKESNESVESPLRSSLTTGYAFFSGSSGRSVSMERPSNHVFPACSMFRYASIMLRFVDLPNLRGLVKRNTSVPLLNSMSSMSGVLSMKYRSRSRILPKSWMPMGIWRMSVKRSGASKRLPIDVA